MFDKITSIYMSKSQTNELEILAKVRIIID